MNGISERFTSRKFLLALAAVLTAVANGQPWAAAVAAAIYVLVEGHVDSKH
jgi:hypothetical protein